MFSARRDGVSKFEENFTGGLVQIADSSYNKYNLKEEVQSNGEEIFVGDLDTRVKTVHDRVL